MDSDLLLEQPDTPAGALNFCLLVYMNTMTHLYHATRGMDETPQIRFRNEILASVTHTASMVCRLLDQGAAEEMSDELEMVHRRLRQVFGQISGAFEFDDLFQPFMGIAEQMQIQQMLEEAIAQGN